MDFIGKLFEVIGYAIAAVVGFVVFVAVAIISVALTVLPYALIVALVFFLLNHFGVI